MSFTLLPCTILHLPRCATCHPLGSSRSSNRAVQPSITGTWVHGCFFTARTPYSVGHWQPAGSQSSGGPQSRTTKQGRGRARARGGGGGAEEVPAALTHPPLHHLLFLFLQSPRFHPPHHHLSINGSRYGVGTQPSSLSASTDPGE